jgi:hypothetical protein
MTLKEKFLPRMYCFFGSGMLTNSYDEKVAEDNAKQCEKIADDYAIEFAEWTQDQDYRNDYDNCHLTMKQLLEIFKKEKGL